MTVIVLGSPIMNRSLTMDVVKCGMITNLTINDQVCMFRGYHKPSLDVGVELTRNLSWDP